MKTENIMQFAENLRTTTEMQGTGSLATIVVNHEAPEDGAFVGYAYCCLGLQSKALGLMSLHPYHEGLCDGDSVGAMKENYEHGTDAYDVLPSAALARWLGYSEEQIDEAVAQRGGREDGDLEMLKRDARFDFKVDWPSGWKKRARSGLVADALYADVTLDHGDDTQTSSLAGLNDSKKFTFAQIGDIVAYFGLGDLVVG